MILTDNRSFRSEPLTTRAEAAPFRPTSFPGVVSEDVTAVLDAGAAAPNASPPATIRFNGVDVPNPRRTAPPLSTLGATQKEWFLDRLRAATTPWKLWGNSVAMLDWRTDFQNLPDDVGTHWPTTGYALFGDDDWSGYRHERAEIFDFVERNGITGLATVCGDRHAFLAGVLSSTLPPHRFHPIAAEFVTGSISAPGLFEAMEFGLPRDHPLRAVYVYQPPGGAAAEPAINLSMMHGVRSSLELQRTHDVRQALAASNPDVAPHLSFADTGGHGYAVVRVAPEDLTVEFVCIPRPIERSASADGGPLAYRVRHRVRLWGAGETPKVVRASREGVLPLVL
jgi:alkaline phosphatase D